ncbi:MAG TPA: cyclic pyranopterin monophosphate synthase MoaC [Nitriliruptorales bacterium]|nr:cyclic pyranopterin monophosphate synthase MoaC [Nitriliruptorales bacterium]
MGDATERPFTHLDGSGRARMVAVGDKLVTERTARAACQVVVTPATARRVAAADLPKGEAVTVARVAGIQAAKRTHELIPFCHQVGLTAVEVVIEVDVETGAIAVTGEAQAVDRTGVEMEALVAVSVAALTLYDMVKAVERGARITDLRLVEKTGGTKGDWHAV